MTRLEDSDQAPRVRGGHAPVLLDAALAALRPAPGGRYLDCTFGGGGHARALLVASAPSGQVVALDADPDATHRAVAIARELDATDRLTFINANFGELAGLRERHEWPLFDGILFDLGLSSFQLDAAERGFAFRLEGPLDMRFDPKHGPSTADLVNSLSEQELTDLIRRFGEEPHARRISRAIVAAREQRPVTQTTELAEIVSQATGGRRGRRIHPATRTFQALRIAVNQELIVLARGVDAAIDALADGGRIGVISFHSLEDRIVKRAFAAAAATCVCPPEQPICTCDTVPKLRLIGRPIQPDVAEQERNPRSRSAILRVAERINIAGALERQRPNVEEHA
jgi:16S rRNA (cytosine1402-N4)-methyltransferase